MMTRALEEKEYDVSWSKQQAKNYLEVKFPSSSNKERDRAYEVWVSLDE